MVKKEAPLWLTKGVELARHQGMVLSADQLNDLLPDGTVSEENLREVARRFEEAGVTLSPDPPEPTASVLIRLTRCRDGSFHVQLDRDTAFGVGSGPLEALHDLVAGVKGFHLSQAEGARSAFDRLFRVGRLEELLRVFEPKKSP